MKSNRLWTALAVLIFLVSAAVSAFMLLRPADGEIEIISDGRLLYTIDPAREAYREITVEYDGRSNLIVIENGDVYVSEADCPDHTCIKTGRLGRSGRSMIVCLPNRLIIRYSPRGGDADATAG